VGFDKGTEAIRLLEKEDFDLVMAMVDDITDDDMFHELPENAITIKVGNVSSIARYSIPQHETNKFLNNLVINLNDKIARRPKVKSKE